MHRLIIIILIPFIANAFCCSKCLAWTVSPVRFEVKTEKGKEYTLTFSVLNESQLYQKRFEVQVDDWILDKENNFLRKAFNKDVVNKYSATNWIKVTPIQFVVPPGETKRIRFTISVPKDLPSDGEYATGIFVGEKNIEKPPKGEKIIHIKQDTFIGVVIYVKIGESKPKVVLKDLKVKTTPLQNNLNKVTLLPVYESFGNVHSRGKALLKYEPLTGGKKEVDGGEIVVLRETEVAYPIDIPEPLLSNTEWKFTVSADFGKDIPLIVGTKKYKIPLKETIKQEKKESTTKKDKS